MSSSSAAAKPACRSGSRSGGGSSQARRRARGALCALLLTAFGLPLLACASGPFASERRVTRERAIARCIEETPAESVLYADEFAACMERQGWIHGSNPS